jgi:anthraniloyl-CoA monooxygenase
MRLTVIGAGPAGLYFAILMKRADRRHDVTIFERNAPDATFGWGVVFSEETLGALREADLRSYVDITEALAQWNTIDIRYRSELIRSRGHSFSGISRKLLLRILQDRAVELGVKSRFLTEVTDAAAFADADLVVAADGCNSTVRQRYSRELGSRVTECGSKFAWFGTDLALDTFTFVFRDTEYGMFRVHAFPSDGSTSTFIVECDTNTWRNAGLDSLTERESMALCEQLFADVLAGHRLLANRSRWRSFARVSNDSWHRGRVVLLGDAAHTAHFSIGSGTKLAMEDSIALVGALDRQQDLERALVDYEMERQPVVERFQIAADESASYFERAASYASFTPLQFAFNLLTRSGRISHTKLAVRDPQFARSLDSWFSTTARGDSADERLQIAPPPMFAPLTCGSLTYRNRIVLCPIHDEESLDGAPTDQDAERLIDAARSGASLVLAAPVAVSAAGRITPRSLTISGDRQTEAWAQTVESVHDTHAFIGIRLSHAGRRGATSPRSRGVDLPLASGGWPLLSPSPIPYTSISRVPKEMNASDRERVVRDFALAAERAAIAGFDVVELDFAHGYLIGSFLSPLTNERGDDYGGPLENRLRFPLEVLDAVRAVLPRDRLIAVRMQAADWTCSGLSTDDAVAIARALAEHGCEVHHVTAGQTVPDDKPDFGRTYLTAMSDLIRSRASVTTLVGGFITTYDEVNTIVGAGRADLCLMTMEPSGSVPVQTSVDRHRAAPGVSLPLTAGVG